MTTTILRLARNTGIGIALVLLSLSSAFAVDLERLLLNPHAYHLQRVKVTGIARVEGYSFLLFQNRREAKTIASVARTLAVAPRNDSPVYGNDKYDRCRVKLTGIVDADRHGRWNYPCELLLEKVEGLSGPLFESALILGAFRNESSQSIELRFFNETDTNYAKVQLGPKDMDDLSIQNGRIEVMSASGKLLTKSFLRVPATSDQHFDAINRAFYYQFKKGKIEMLSVGEGKRWGLFSEKH